MGAGIGEADVAELETALDDGRDREAAGLGVDGGLHVEEGDEIGEKEGLVGDAGGGREDLLEIGAGLLDGGGEEGELADVVGVAEGAPDDVDVGAVVAEGADDAEQAADDELGAGERDVFAVDLVGEGLEAGGEVLTEAEELDFFGAFAGAGDLAEVVHLALGGGLAEVLGVAEKGVVGSRRGKEGRTPRASRRTSQGLAMASAAEKVMVVMTCWKSRPIIWIMAKRSVAWTRARSRRS